MANNNKMKLVLPDGRQFHGLSCGADKPVCGELVFNSSMVGYQEILSDPSYAGQIIVMTYPLIGQYGITDEDFESKTPGLAGFIVRECCDTPSNFRYTKTLPEYLDDKAIPCLSGIDTRMLTHIIREEGSMTAALVPEETPVSEAMDMIKAHVADKDAVKNVTCTKRRFARTPQHSHDVVILDCGLKQSVVAALTSRGCNVTVVPATSSADEILAFNPDGLLISSGPGNPEDASYIVDVVNELKGKLPIFGISLGHCLLALSYGASIYKLKSGHHGGYPVRDLETGRIVTVEMNHNYAVCEDSALAAGLKLTYRNVADGTLAGIANEADKVYSVQFNPEGGPGPEETDFFDKFVKMMEE